MTETLERVKTYQQFIGGEFVDAADGRDGRGHQPGQRRGHRQRPGELARTSTGPSTPPRPPSRPGRRRPAGPVALLLKIADALEAKADELGRLESANAGKPVGAAIDEMATCVDLFRFFAGGGARHGRPRGQRVRGRPHLDHPTRPDRRRRVDRAMELPALHGEPGSWARRSRPATRSSSSRPRGRRCARSRSLRSSPRSCRPAWSTSCPARAPISVTRWSVTPRSGWSRSPVTPRPASGSRRSRPTPSSGSTSSSAARRRSSSSTTPTSSSPPRRSARRATGTPARTAPRPPA